MADARMARAVARIQRQRGEEMTLRRPGSPNVDVIVWGKQYQPSGGPVGEPIAGAGNARQAVLRIKLSNAEIAAAGWPGPPRRGDRIIIGTRHYILEGDADTRTAGTTILAHMLVVKGGPAV